MKDPKFCGDDSDGLSDSGNDKRISENHELVMNK